MSSVVSNAADIDNLKENGACKLHSDGNELPFLTSLKQCSRCAAAVTLPIWPR